MALHLWIVLVSLCLACTQWHMCATEPSEPSCYSRFDYDEKLLLKLLRIEDEMGKFRQIVDDVKKKEAQMEMQRMKERNEYLAAKKQVEALYDVVEEKLNISEANMKNEIENLRADLPERTNPSPVLFTVKGPTVGPSSNAIAFQTPVLIEGTDYDIKTNRFTCSIPGIYYFNTHIVKLRSSTRVDSTKCSICKNGSCQAKSFTDPDDSADIGSYGVSNSAYVKLAKGDVVNLCYCSRPETMDQQSSFSGRLVYRDPE